MMQCLLPMNGARSKHQNTRPWTPAKYERTDSHSGQTDRIILTTANRVGWLYPPEVELLEPRTAWEQKSPQVGIGIDRVRLWLLGGQLGLLGLLGLFFLKIGLVIWAGHRSLGTGREIAEMWRVVVAAAGVATVVSAVG